MTPHILIMLDSSTPHDRFIKTPHVTHRTPAHPSTPTLRRPAVAHLRIGTVMVRRTARRRGTQDAEQWGLLSGCCLRLLSPDESYDIINCVEWYQQHTTDY